MATIRAVGPEPISIADEFGKLTFMPDRTPGHADERAFSRIAGYRDGGVFIVHYAGSSEWERHGVGDEVVMVVDGSTTMTLLVEGEEVAHTLGPGEMVVVPRGVWHRFDTPEGVKVMTVTPQPTDHRVDRPTS